MLNNLKKTGEQLSKLVSRVSTVRTPPHVSNTHTPSQFTFLPLLNLEKKTIV